MESICGRMEEFIKVIGGKIKCTGMGCLLGVMVKNMMDHTLMIKKRDMVFFIGQMAKNIKEIGRTANNMEKDVW